MDESIIMSNIIDKLPPSWKDFKRNLKHKKEDISLEQLANSLRVEEEIREEMRIQDETKEHSAHISKVHVMEEGQPFKFSNKRPIQYNNTQKFKNKKKKRVVVIFVANKDITSPNVGTLRKNKRR